MELEEDGEVKRLVTEEKGNELEAITFGEEKSLEVPEEFPPSLKIQVASLFLVCWQCKN